LFPISQLSHFPIFLIFSLCYLCENIFGVRGRVSNNRVYFLSVPSVVIFLGCVWVLKNKIYFFLCVFVSSFLCVLVLFFNFQFTISKLQFTIRHWKVLYFSVFSVVNYSFELRAASFELKSCGGKYTTRNLKHKTSNYFTLDKSFIFPKLFM